MFYARWHGFTLWLQTRLWTNKGDPVPLMRARTNRLSAASMRKTVEHTISRAARNRLLNCGPRADQATKKPDPLLRRCRVRVLTRPAQTASTSFSPKSVVSAS